MPAFGAGLLARPGTIRITGQQIRHTHVDVGRRGPSGGDLDLFRVLLFNRRITPKPIGHAQMVCTYAGSNAWSCTATYFLPKGKIVVGGVIGSPLIYELAVLGGTGLYANVRGALTVTSLSRKPSRSLLVFRLQV